LLQTYTDSQGRTKQRKRAIPAGLSKRDQRILRSVRRRAHYLDKGFNLCGFRVGWTFWLGLIPGLGDVVDFLLGYCLVVRKCRKADLPAVVVSKLMTNLIIGTCLGVVPIVGDIMLATVSSYFFPLRPVRPRLTAPPLNPLPSPRPTRSGKPTRATRPSLRTSSSSAPSTPTPAPTPLARAPTRRPSPSRSSTTHTSTPGRASGSARPHRTRSTTSSPTSERR